MSIDGESRSFAYILTTTLLDNKAFDRVDISYSSTYIETNCYFRKEDVEYVYSLRVSTRGMSYCVDFKNKLTGDKVKYITGDAKKEASLSNALLTINLEILDTLKEYISDKPEKQYGNFIKQVFFKLDGEKKEHKLFILLTIENGRLNIRTRDNYTSLKVEQRGEKIFEVFNLKDKNRYNHSERNIVYLVARWLVQ